jgi:hypothetical protein
MSSASKSAIPSLSAKARLEVTTAGELQEKQRLVTLYLKDGRSIRLDTAQCNCRLRSVMSRRMQQTRKENLLQNRMVVRRCNNIYATKASGLKTRGQKYIMTALNVVNKIKTNCFYT